MEEKLVKMRNVETDEIVFHISNVKSKFVEGKEFIPVRRWENDKLITFILKSSLRRV